MLRKLIKHEFRATAKTFLFVYAAVVVLALVNALLISWGAFEAQPAHEVPVPAEISMSGVTYGIAILLYILSLIAAGIVTLVVVIRRFNTNLLGDEGYLMFTLPVSREQHMTAKLITALVWSLCSIILIVGSFLLLFARLDLLETIRAFLAAASEAGYTLPLWFAGTALLAVAFVVEAVLILYASMAIGPNLLKNRVGGSIVAFIIVAVLAQIVSSVIARLANMLPVFSDAQAEIQAAAANASAPFDPLSLYGADILKGVGSAAFLTMLVTSVIISVTCWFVTRYMLRRKLNLT